MHHAGIIVMLGLGANLGPREQQLQKAVTRLGAWMGDMKCSPVYESKALMPQGAPVEWNRPFLNMAVRGKTTLAAAQVLSRVKIIESELGRQKRDHWGPREIDIDILAYGDGFTRLPGLIVPHPQLLKRDFALIPFADVAPDWIHPAKHGKTAAELAEELPRDLRKTSLFIS